MARLKQAYAAQINFRRAEMYKFPSPEQHHTPELIRGGSGRTGKELHEDFHAIGWTWAVLILAGLCYAAWEYLRGVN
jgi:hypothetical protein